MRHLLLTALFALPAVITAADGPAWALERPVEDGALFGVASAASAAEARAAAAADIAAQLLQSVSSTRTSDKAQTVQTKDGATTKETTAKTASSTTASTSAKYLPGVEVVKEEAVGGTTWVLVRLDKAKFATAAQARIAVLDGLLGKLVPAPAVPTGPRLAALRRAIATADERDTLALTLAGQGVGIAASALPLEEIRAQLGALAEPPVLALKNADRAPGVRDALLDVLDAIDATVATKPDEARFELRLVEKGRPATLPNGWVKLALTGAVTVVRLDTGEVIGSFEASATKTSTRDEADAMAGARVELIKSLGDEARARLLPILIAAKSP